MTSVSIDCKLAALRDRDTKEIEKETGTKRGRCIAVNCNGNSNLLQN